MKNQYLILIAGMILLSCNRNQVSDAGSHLDSLSAKHTRILKTGLADNDFSDGIKYVNRLRDSLLNAPDPKARVRWYRMQAYNYLMMNDPAPVKQYLDSALAIAGQDSSLTYELLFIYRDLANAAIMEQDPEGAMEYSLRAHKLAVSKHPEGLNETIATLADCYNNNGDSANLYKYALWGYQQAEKEVSKNHFAVLLAISHRSRGNSDSALYYAKQSFASNHTYPADEQMTRLYNMGYLMLELDQPREAKSYFTMVLDSGRKHRLPHPDTYFMLAELFLGEGKTDQFVHYMDTAISQYRDLGRFEDIRIAFNSKARNIPKATPEYILAQVDSAQRYHAAADSASLMERIRKVEARYELKEKEERIASLAQSKKRNIITFSISGLLILTAGGALIMLLKNRNTSLALKERLLLQRLNRSLIDSHLWFNCLTIVKNQIKSGESDNATKYLSKFSRLASINMANASSDRASLEDEVMAIRLYLEMQQLIQGNFFSFEINCDIDLEDQEIYVMPMLMQPFVENAIVHGFNPTFAGAHLSITITEENGMIRCLIIDNGRGIERREEGHHRRSHATTITRDRLAILSQKSGKRSSLDISNRNDGARGVRVELVFPILLVTAGSRELVAG